MSRTVMIAGSEGNLGRVLTRLFQESGWRAIPYSKASESVDLFIHAAARLKDGSQAATIRSNIDFLQETIAFCELRHIQAFVYISSVSIHGAPQTKTIDENTPIHCNDLYSHSKYFGEGLVTNSPLTHLILRIPALLELKDNPTNFISKLYRALTSHQDIRLNVSDAPFNSFASPFDIFDVIVHFADKPTSSTLVVAGNPDCTLTEIALYLKELTNSDSQIQFVSSANEPILYDISQAKHKFGFNPKATKQSLHQWHVMQSEIQNLRPRASDPATKGKAI